MVQALNQFAQTPEVGDLDLQYSGNVVTCMVASTQATALIPGQAVKMADVAGGAPKVVALAANTDTTFGFVIRNLKDATFAASSMVEVAIAGSVQYMTAGAAIARGASVEVVVSTNKVITSAGTNPVVGFALDKATADGDIIRVFVLTPSYSVQQGALDAALKTVRVTATLAEINAGKELVPARTGKQIRVTNYIARVSGAFTTTTSVDLQDGTTGTKVTALAQAGLTNGAILMPSSSNTTLGAGFGADLGSGESLKVVNTGSAAAGGTSITFTVSYCYV